jgi:TonB-dependent receptor
MRLTLLFTFLVSFTFTTAFAERISGVVSDSLSGELLIGAHVTLTNTSTDREYNTYTGLNGSFSIGRLQAGEYTVQVSYIGYYRRQFSVILVNEHLDLPIRLYPDLQSLDDVVITANERGSDSQARDIERISVTVMNVVSARQIELSPDITVANVIQRVSGLSIERNGSGDPQYAVVRGMNKRYNNTLVNGIKIPSPDNDNRFVPLDIFPAVFLERLEVSKSLNASMEADAIGGTVNMVMKSAPYTRTLDTDVQMGYNQMNFTRPFGSYDRSTVERRSPKERFGETYRATPDDFPVDNMTLREITPMPDILASVTYGDRFLRGRRLGLMAGASFQNSYKPMSNYFYDPSVNNMPGNPLIMRELIERETSTQMQRIAFHTKFDFNLSDNHNFGLYAGKYLLNEFRVRDQIRQESFVATNNYAVYPITRFTNIFQDITTIDLSGRHSLSRSFTAVWNLVFSQARNERPDDGVFSRAGQFDVATRTLSNEIVYFQGTRNSRAWERNKDTDYAGYLNFRYNLDRISTGSSLQFGGAARLKVRDNYYNYYNYSQIFGQFRGEDWNEFGEVRFASMANPLGSGDRSNLVYDAYEDVYAGYVNTVWTISSLELQAGLRAENTIQSYEINALSAASSDTELTQEQQYLNLFPSASMKIPVTRRASVKVNYYKGISRPGFYEIVPTIRSSGGGDSFYSERGNADLRPSIGHSADLRYEFFPGGVDQVLLGVFYKRIIDPIEYGFPQVVNTDQPPNISRILPQNYDDATNFGVEADVTRYLNRFGIRMNYTYTRSQITTDKVVIEPNGQRSLVSQTRPLQGQSNHIANVSLLYKDIRNRLDVQFVFNYTGERIAVVSPFAGADHYMMAMTQLDFSVEKGFGDGFVLFAKANNILNTPYKVYVKKPLAIPEDPYPHQTDPANVGFVRRDLFGQSYRLGLRYKL